MAVTPESLLECFEGPAVLLDAEYRIVAANAGYLREFAPQGVAPGARCYEVSHGYRVSCDLAGESCPLRRSFDGGQRQRVLHVHASPRGDEHVDVETLPIRDEEGRVVWVVEHIRRAQGFAAQPSSQAMVGRSPAFNRMLGLISRVAPSRTPVLLQGESGTGKELAARAIHDASLCADGPFVPVECSGLSETLFESELFGHERGAFTGAVARKQGLIEAARGGTLFLDEVGDIPLGQQVKLLRLLETGTYRPVGSVTSHQADFRLVCATHRDLKGMIAQGTFRQDLYYRISAFPVDLPPLRDRPEDLPLLVESLLQRITGERRLQLDAAALAALRRYEFPGNVRELRNILEHAALLADGDTISLEHLPRDCACSGGGDGVADLFDCGVVPLEVVERRYLMRVLRSFQGDRRELAARLGVSERTLYRKLEGIQSCGGCAGGSREPPPAGS
ncbi:MAG: sigma-54-dependent Fis family transcriptional regulator [Gammaproteobacteria bacterium]|jgi:DNA-binding NtrC family response regulator|nr:sigma-54-dependent Fis family transcriptional regulator [Gammaproteobacteria bacterium]